VRWTSSDGRTVVEAIRITNPGTGRDMEQLRIKRDGSFHPTLSQIILQPTR
jgi:hypothetical protein